MKTLGISPKLVAAILAAAVAYLLGQSVLELPPLAVIALQLASIALATYQASPGTVLPVEDEPVGDVDGPAL